MTSLGRACHTPENVDNQGGNTFIMKLDRILPFARLLLEKAVQEGDVVIDATVGNGNDTLFLANLVGATGNVYGFDIQEDAIQTTSSKIKEHQLEQVTLFQTGHENMKDYIPSIHHRKVTGAIFNLGYLPGGNKEIVTKSATTIAAIEQLLEITSAEGIIVLVIYHGHEEGAIERDDLLQYVQKIDQAVAHVLEYKFINQKNNPPFIIAIEKR